MKDYIIPAFLLAIGGFGLSACSGETNVPRQESLISSAVEISEARVRPPLPGQKIAAGYFTLESAAGDRLLAVTTPASARVELHNHINDGGVMRMRRIDGGVDIPAGGSIEFKPGSYHIMLFDAKITPQSEDIALTFDFETAEDVTIIADIMSSEAYGSGGADKASRGSGEAKGEEDKKAYGSGH
jgi:copper(I)-binding protein